MPMHLTLRALREATNDWYLNIDNTILNDILFLELKKAFDTVDHQILFQECKLYGVDTRTKVYLCRRFPFEETANCLWSALSGAPNEDIVQNHLT